MASPTSTHLRVHVECLIVDGLVHIENLAGAAARDRQPALAVAGLVQCLLSGAHTG